MLLKMHVAGGSNATRLEFYIRTVDFQITVITRNVPDKVFVLLAKGRV